MAIGKLTYRIRLSKYVKVLYPLWFIQSALGINNLYMPKWAFRLELEK